MQSLYGRNKIELWRCFRAELRNFVFDLFLVYISCDVLLITAAFFFFFLYTIFLVCFSLCFRFFFLPIRVLLGHTLIYAFRPSTGKIFFTSPPRFTQLRDAETTIDIFTNRISVDVATSTVFYIIFHLSHVF